MAITTAAQLNDAMAGAQQLLFTKTQTLTGQGSSLWSGVFDRIGLNPAAGTLAGSNTANGVVPTDATTGCPAITDFGGGNTGYLGAVKFVPTVTSTNGFRFRLCDMLFKAGAYSFNSAVTLTTQPSYSSRIPGGDYKGTEIWLEGVTAGTLVQSVVVTYTNQDGTTGRSTGTVSVNSALVAGRMVQLPLQAGDTGVQKIESVTGSVASAGAFNILVLRPLWMGSLAGRFTINHTPDKTDLPIVFGDSALIFMCQPDGATVPAFDAVLSIAQG